MKKITTQSNEDTKKLAQDMASKFTGGEIVALVGDLGAGKTTFTQGIAKYFNISDPVSSPTFALIQEYPIEKSIHVAIKTVIHVDCYRLNSPDELVDIGIQDYFDRDGTLAIIEWADKVKDILPKQTRWIAFAHGDKEDERIITIQ